MNLPPQSLVANPIRQNMPTIKVEPDGDDQAEMAEIANGMFRRIQYNSSASHVYANAVEHMVNANLDGVEFVCANTDAQALTTSKAERIIQMGVQVTEGLGAGSQPEVGRAAAEEAREEIREQLQGAVR